MRRLLPFVLFAALLLPAVAQEDSVDVTEYRINMRVGFSGQPALSATTQVDFRLLRHCDTVILDLKDAAIDTLFNPALGITPYRYDAHHLYIYAGNLTVGTTHSITVQYHKNRCLESYGWGGFHTDGDIYYNLGVAFQDYPHSYGRAWFPCRDNFTDRATYRYEVTTPAGWKAICGGVHVASTTHPEDGTHTSVWELTTPIPTYLASFAVAQWRTIEHDYTGAHGTYPAILGYTSGDSSKVEAAFAELNQVLPMYERCLGPYRWGRIGYVQTPQGSMEHACNIALTSSCMTSTDPSCQSVIAHEFAHAWFGNLVCCSQSQDMWINEGGASFCEELAMEATHNRNAADDYYEANLEEVIRTCHHVDGDYLPLHGVAPDVTYGNTTYNKGALVWHSLRGYLGDSLFYASLRTLFANNAYSAMDAYQMRDTLSLYSGVDLTDFFDFHVFNGGFADYHITHFGALNNGATLSLCQTTIGTTQLPRNGRIPVTFFSADRQQQSKHWIRFPGYSTTIDTLVQMPFTPAFAALDYDRDISDAVTDDDVTIHQPGPSFELPLAHFAVKAARINETAHLRVEHHWSQPSMDNIPEGVIRLSNRYWTVTGQLPLSDSIVGQFRYTRSGAYAYLDEHFFEKEATADSLALLYRANASEPWTLVSHRRNSSTYAGYMFADNLLLGQYALAVVDTNVLSLQSPEVCEVSVHPNPTSGWVTIASTQPFSRFEVVDMQGRKVYSRQFAPARQQTVQLPSALPQGVYTLVVHTAQGITTEKIIKN